MVCCTPSLRPNDRVDQCVAPCGGGSARPRENARLQLRASTPWASSPRCRAVRPATPSASNRRFQRAIVRELQPVFAGDARVAVAVGQQQDDARPTRGIGAPAAGSLSGFEFGRVAQSSTQVESMACAIVRFTSRQYKPLHFGAQKSYDWFALIPEAHLLLFKEDQVLLLRRQNTGYSDGNYSIIAGHIENNETAQNGMLREALEEAGLKIEPQHLRFCHVAHRKAKDERVSFFFTASQWNGEPRNREPHKCRDLAWFTTSALPPNMVGYVRQAIEKVLRGEFYSEFGWTRPVAATDGGG